MVAMYVAFYLIIVVVLLLYGLQKPCFAVSYDKYNFLYII